jgi:hypothetical protein
VWTSCCQSLCGCVFITVAHMTNCLCVFFYCRTYYKASRSWGCDSKPFCCTWQLLPILSCVMDKSKTRLRRPAASWRKLRISTSPCFGGDKVNYSCEFCMGEKTTFQKLMVQNHELGQKCPPLDECPQNTIGRSRHRQAPEARAAPQRTRGLAVA